MHTIVYLVKVILLFPHFIVYILLPQNIKNLILSDVEEMNKRLQQSKSLLYYLAFYKPYRNLFYYRLGAKKSKLLKCLMAEYPLFIISSRVKHIGGKAFVLNHPYGTILNAEYIGDNFTVCQLTTLGNKKHGHNEQIPKIAKNVSLGANVSILGGITIGDNVVVGAGSVIVKDVPNNCIVAGNPARVIRKLSE